MSIYLLIGVVIFALVHLYPAACGERRQLLIKKIGVGPYKGLFSVATLGALFMIIFGWRNSDITNIYTPPEWGRLAVVVLMYPALFLFISASMSGNVKRIIRHPQLSAVALWGFAHILANGESRSVFLFGLFIAWALVEMIFLNRRDGEWQKPSPLPWFQDIKIVLISLVIYVGLMSGHGYFTGISLAP